MMRFGKVSLTKLMVTILGQRTFAPSWEQNSTWADARIPSVSPLAFAPRSRSKSLQFHLLNLSRATSETVLHYTIVFEKKIHEIFVNQDEQRVLPIIVWTSIAVRLVKHDPWSSQASDVTEHDVILHSSHCRKKGNWPMDGNCQVQSVHRATVETADCRKDYTGPTALTFKERFSGHQYSVRHRSHRNSTALSKYVWSLKDKNTDFNIRWSVRRRATAYQNTTRRCNLSLAPKLSDLKSVELELGSCCSDFDKKVSDEICRTRKRQFEIPFRPLAASCPQVTSCLIPPGRLSRKRRRTNWKDFYLIPQHHKP